MPHIKSDPGVNQDCAEFANAFPCKSGGWQTSYVLASVPIL